MHFRRRCKPTQDNAGNFQRKFFAISPGDTLTIAPIKILGDDCVGDPKLFSLIVGLRGSPLSESTPEKDFLDGIKGGLYCDEVKPPKDDGGELGGEKMFEGSKQAPGKQGS